MTEQKENTRYIVRIAGKDLDGSLPIERALLSIKGIGHRMARNIAVAFEKKSGILTRSKLGELPEEKDKVLEEVLMNPQNHGIPTWNFNRQKDVETGKEIHLLTNELDFSKRQDLQKLSEIKSYKGLRHSWGLTVRGQRTRSTHRGKGGAVGVTKKDAKGEKKDAPKTAEKSVKPVAAAKKK